MLYDRRGNDVSIVIKLKLRMHASYWKNELRWAVWLKKEKITVTNHGFAHYVLILKLY